MGEIIKIDHISYAYHGVGKETLVLHDVSFSVSEGEIVAIVGPVGCGKSTLLSLIAGLLVPTKGRVLINKAAATASDKSIGYMLQKDQLTDWHNTLKNVTLGPELQHELSDNSYVQINELMNTYGLITFINSYSDDLSEGMRKRAALIRTLLLEPDILLLDEPFSSLDYQTRLDTEEDIWEVLRKEKKTALLITHDIAEAISMADRVILFSENPGTIQQIFKIKFSMKDRTPNSVRNSPEFEDYSYQIRKALKHKDSGNI